MSDFMDNLSNEKERIARERVHAAAHEIVATLKSFSTPFNVQNDGFLLDVWIIRLRAYTFTSIQLKRAINLLAERDIVVNDFVVTADQSGVNLSLIVTVKYL